MTARIAKAEPFDLVVLGGAGELAYRTLDPTPRRRETNEQLNGRTGVIGASRRPLDREASSVCREPPRPAAAGARIQEFA